MSGGPAHPDDSGGLLLKHTLPHSLCFSGQGRAPWARVPWPPPSTGPCPYPALPVGISTAGAQTGFFATMLWLNRQWARLTSAGTCPVLRPLGLCLPWPLGHEMRCSGQRGLLAKKGGTRGRWDSAGTVNGEAQGISDFQVAVLPGVPGCQWMEVSTRQFKNKAPGREREPSSRIFA